MNDQNELTLEEKELVAQFDRWLEDGGPAALVIREPLEPVEGMDGVFFPATFAAEQGNDPDRFRGGYNIDTFGDERDGRNVCLVDTVGSQANRMEPVFTKAEWAGLVPQVTIRINEERRINLLEAGHRAGDAIVRCSELKDDLEAAFRELLKGNAEPLAKIAPTSLVFGVWDSRSTHAKLPRLISGTIRAFNVALHSRHAQYNPVVNFKKEGLLDGIDVSDDDLAAKGYVSQPIGKQPGKPDPTHGGVQLTASGLIRRDSSLGLAALRRLSVLETDGTLSTNKTLLLRRYILGLALVALTAEQDTYLRQGCNLVPADEGKSRTFEIVFSSGRRMPVFQEQEAAKRFAEENPKEPTPIIMNSDIALGYAKLAARDFGIDPRRDVSQNALPDRIVQFRTDLAQKDINGDTEKVKGDVISFDAGESRFKLSVGKKNHLKEMDVTTNDNTTFVKGKEESTFDVVVVQGATLNVEMTNGIAVKVIGKK